MELVLYTSSPLPLFSCAPKKRQVYFTLYRDNLRRKERISSDTCWGFSCWIKWWPPSSTITSTPGTRLLKTFPSIYSSVPQSNPISLSPTISLAGTVIFDPCHGPRSSQLLPPIQNITTQSIYIHTYILVRIADIFGDTFSDGEIVAKKPVLVQIVCVGDWPYIYIYNVQQGSQKGFCMLFS